MSEATKPRQELEREGWKPASLSSGIHLMRILEMHEELGFDKLQELVMANMKKAYSEITEGEKENASHNFNCR